MEKTKGNRRVNFPRSLFSLLRNTHRFPCFCIDYLSQFAYISSCYMDTSQLDQPTLYEIILTIAKGTF